MSEPMKAPVKAAPKAPALRDPGTYRVGTARGAIWIITDDDQLARILRGENIPKAERKVKRYVSGEIVKGIPATSVPWMLSGGWIEPAADAPKGGDA